VTVEGASGHLGVSADTIKRRLKAGELVGHQEPTPRVYIWLVGIPDDMRVPQYPFSCAATCDVGLAGLEVVEGPLRGVEDFGPIVLQWDNLQVFKQETQDALQGYPACRDVESVKSTLGKR
jgi:hypothetical protein